MIKTLINKILEDDNQFNQNELFYYIMGKSISGDDLDYLLEIYERLKSKTVPEQNFARTALIIGSKQLIIRGIREAGVNVTDEVIDDCVFNLLRIIDKYDKSKNVSYSTYVVTYTKYYLQRQYRDLKDDATNQISVWLDQKVNDDSDTEMHNMIGIEDEYFEDFDITSDSERFEQEVEEIKKYFCYLTHDEQYVFSVVNGIYYTQRPIKVLAKEINVNYNTLSIIYKKAKIKLESIFAKERTPEQQEIYEKYKDLKFSILSPEEILNYQLTSISNDHESNRKKSFTTSYHHMKQIVEEVINKNELSSYKLSVLQEKILYLYYGIDRVPLSSPQIAKELGISLTSTTTHIATIKRKLLRTTKQGNRIKTTKKDVLEILNENKYNIYLVPKHYHSLIKQYYGIGEDLLSVEELCKIYNKTSSELFRILSMISSVLQTNYSKLAPLYIRDIDKFIKEKNIQIDSIFNQREQIIFSKFYGIGQEQTDIEKISLELKTKEFTIFKTINNINLKLNSLNGFLTPDINMSNDLIRNIIELYEIKLKNILSNIEQQIIDVFIADDFENIDKNITKRFNLTTYKSNKLLFSALSKIVKIYNEKKLKGELVESDSLNQTDQDKKLKLTKQQKIILSLYIGLDGRQLSIDEISRKLSINPSKVYKELKAIDEMVHFSLENLDVKKKVILPQMLIDEKHEIDKLNQSKKSWWTKSFITTLPLEDILSPYQYSVISLYFGLNNKPLNISEIATKLNVKKTIISSNISSSKAKIKKYIIENNVSYITSVAKPEIKPVKTKTEKKERKTKNICDWWQKDFLLTLPLNEILSDNQYKIISLKFGFNGEPKKNIEIARILNWGQGSVASYLSCIKSKIKEYMLKNQISYLTEKASAEIKPIKSIKERERGETKKSNGWWNKEFLITLPLDEILTPNQFRILELKFGFNENPKNNRDIAKIMNYTISSVAVYLSSIKSKIKKYLIENNISYITESGVECRFESFETIYDEEEITTGIQEIKLQNKNSLFEK